MIGISLRFVADGPGYEDRSHDPANASETILKKNIHAIISPAAKALEIRPPPEIVGADQEVASRRYSVRKIPRLVSRSTAVGNVLVPGIIRREPGVDGEIFRELEVGFRPASATSDLTAVREVDALPGASSNIAHISAPPALAAQCQKTGKRHADIDIEQLAVKIGPTGDRSLRRLKPIETAETETDRSVLSGWKRVAYASLKIGKLRFLSIKKF